MATYYINGSNTSGTFPYNSSDVGAKNFYELTTDIATRVQLQDGDVIYVYNPATTGEVINDQYVVDDSANDIDINVSVSIQAQFDANLRPKIKLKSDGVGFNVTANDVKFKKINFYKDPYSGGTSVYSTNTEKLYIDRCIFSYDPVSVQSGVVVQLIGCVYATVVGCDITVPSDGGGYGIQLINCNKSIVQGNNISMLDGATGIEISTLGVVRSYGNRVFENLIYNMTQSNNRGIRLIGYCDDIDVYRNVIRYTGESTVGIQVAVNTTHGKNIDIRNNVLISEESEASTYGVLIAYVGASDVTEYKVVNNIVYYNGGATNDGYAFGLGMVNGIIDNNCIYNFDSAKIVDWDGSPNTITEMGSHTLTDIDPEILTLIDSDVYATSAFNSYKLSSSSQCLGVGINYENLGLNEEDEYTSIVDTVTYNIGKIQVDDSSNLQTTFLSDTFTESINTINTIYNKSYKVDDNFQNQYSWDTVSIDDDFPFTSGNHLYDQDIIYVIKNRDSLVPFDNITCPANPGYGFSAYSGYETGIFGNSRVEYINTCLGDPCIIQDDYIIEIIWIDSIDDGDTIQDSINPPCISGGI